MKNWLSKAFNSLKKGLLFKELEQTQEVGLRPVGLPTRQKLPSSLKSSINLQHSGVHPHLFNQTKMAAQFNHVNATLAPSKLTNIAGLNLPRKFTGTIETPMNTLVNKLNVIATYSTSYERLNLNKLV